MNTHTINFRFQRSARLLLLCGAVGLAQLPMLTGAQYAINWYKVSGGGGTSTNSVYSIKGTIGQHDAGGPMTNAQYALTGGFWFALQTPGAPLLAIVLTSSNSVLVYWPSPSTGFNLQQNSDLNTSNWVPPAETVNDNGVIKYIVVNPPAVNRFYRLKK